MKIKVKEISFSDFEKIKKPKHKNPKKPSFILNTVIRIASIFDLKKVGFTYTEKNMDKALKTPSLILMNHSSFIDLKIVSKLFYPKRYSIVCTSDGFVGKETLMRYIGCIPTKKFIRDIRLISNMRYALHTLKVSVLMYPEASYSFDGKATTLPRNLGGLIKKLGVPVVTVITDGAFLLDPLYNGLQKRKAKVSAKVECILTPEEISKTPAEEIDKMLDNAFSFDHFKAQMEKSIEIRESFRADGLQRILYKCPACLSEGKTEGKGEYLYCHGCGKKYYLTPLGSMKAEEGTTEISHIPDWYSWQREEVKKELLNGSYSLASPVEIYAMRDYKAIYSIGRGTLTHSEDGFTLRSENGELTFQMAPKASYSLYADYFWYEIGDIICIGDSNTLYYCKPITSLPVAKARLAAEELYKLKTEKTEKANV